MDFGTIGLRYFSIAGTAVPSEASGFKLKETVTDGN